MQVVGETDLPEGVERVIVERPGLPPLLLLAPSAAPAWRLMREFEDAYGEVVEQVRLYAV